MHEDKFTSRGTEAKAVADIVAEGFQPTILNLEGQVTGDDGFIGTEVIALPDGVGGIRLKSVKEYIDEYRTKPERRKGTATLNTLASFIDLTNRFKDEDSAIFANNCRDNPSIRTVFDYHKAGAESDPRFGEHTAIYRFPLSDEWKAWLNQDGNEMSQIEFAAFLEDRIPDVELPPNLEDVKDPDPATQKLMMMMDALGGRLASPQKLMELSRGLKITAEERVHQHQNLSSGESQIQFKHEHRDEQGQPLKVPNAFLINIPVFKLGDAFRIQVRLRYRVRGGQIHWSYNLYRIDQVFDVAFADAADLAAAGTELPLFFGSEER